MSTVITAKSQKKPFKQRKLLKLHAILFNISCQVRTYEFSRISYGGQYGKDS